MQLASGSAVTVKTCQRVATMAFIIAVLMCTF